MDRHADIGAGRCAPARARLAKPDAIGQATPLGDLLRWQVRENHGVPGGALVVPGDPERSLVWVRTAATEPAMRMPPLARMRVDEPAVRLLGEWIRGLGES